MEAAKLQACQLITFRLHAEDRLLLLGWGRRSLSFSIAFSSSIQALCSRDVYADACKDQVLCEQKLIIPTVLDTVVALSSHSCPFVQ